MKKAGFTLAEVLITLGIIGVVAALAAPALNSAVQKSKVGPSLRKFSSTMENANERILMENNIDRISTGINSADDYYKNLMAFVKGSTEENTLDKLDHKITTYNGTLISNEDSKYKAYTFSNGDAVALWWKVDLSAISSFSKNPNGLYKGDIARGMYDINGFGTLPNRIGKDIFMFILDDSGVIVWHGGKQAYSAYTYTTEEQAWKGNTTPCNKTSVDTGYTCAGSIADNDWKVIYKY